MLFLGTARFPDESGFAGYISSVGGSNNAFTSAERTTYYFDCGGASLPAALERFADFFVAPLFTVSGTSREVAAIDAEHAKNLLDDGRRLDRLLRDRARPEHPFSQFFTGTRATLRDGGDGARAALLAFYARYYKAEHMSLCVVGPQSLDELQRIVTSAFRQIPYGGLPSASSAYDALPRPLEPVAQGTTRTATVAVPVKELRIAKVSWCVDIADRKLWDRTKPASILALVLGSRSATGLIAYLKRKGLASSVDLTVDESTHSYAVLSATIGLTVDGLRRWSEAVGAVYSYLRVLREDGLPAHTYRDIAQLRQLAFQYAEPAAPRALALSSVSALSDYPQSEWLTGPRLILAPADAPAAVAELLAAMVPTNGLVTLAAKDFAALAVEREPYYGTAYGSIPIETELRVWEGTERIPGLTAPPPNRFIPFRLASKAARLCRGSECWASTTERRPALLVQTTGVRLHWLPDRLFGQPKAYASFALRSASLCASAAATVRAELFVAMLSDALQPIGEETAQAGLVYSVGVVFDSFVIQLGGFDQRLPELLSIIARTVRSFPLRPAVFNRKLDALQRGLRGLGKRQPGALCAYYRELALQSPRFTSDDLLEASRHVTLDELRAFQQGFVREAELESFVGGNLLEHEARALVEQLRTDIQFEPLAPSARVARRVRRVAPAGGRDGGVTRQYVAPNPEERNSATEVYLQLGPDEGGSDWLYLSLLARMMSKPFFGELRTRQQLGYLVQAAADESVGVRGLVLAVQSTVLAPPAVEARVEAFLEDYRRTLARMSDGEFAEFRDAAVAQILDVDSRLDVQCTRLWVECAKRRYDFGRPWERAENMRAVTLDGMRTFYDRRVAASGEQRRRLSTHVFSAKIAPRTLQLDELTDDLYPEEPDLLLINEV